MTVHIHGSGKDGKYEITVLADTPHEFYVAVMTGAPPDSVCSICHKTYREHSEEEFGKCWALKKWELMKNFEANRPGSKTPEP